MDGEKGGDRRSGDRGPASALELDRDMPGTSTTEGDSEEHFKEVRGSPTDYLGLGGKSGGTIAAADFLPHGG